MFSSKSSKIQTPLPSFSKSEASNQGISKPNGPSIALPAPKRTFFGSEVLATALFRCWHILCFFTAWSTLITVLNERGIKVAMQPTLLTAAGTVLGFVVSYRTTASFERYNEGRKLWAQIILASRTMARTIWFHVPDAQTSANQDVDEAKCRSLIEKHSAINLLEAFSVAIKHYLRGEHGIYYADLYHLVKFLPAYKFPSNMNSMAPEPSPYLESIHAASPRMEDQVSTIPTLTRRNGCTSIPVQDLPAPVTHGVPGANSNANVHLDHPQRMILSTEEERHLLPAYNPPKNGILDVVLFPALVQLIASRTQKMHGRRAARIRAKMESPKSHNLPLEISFYLSSYISSLQSRKICDVPTTNSLFASLNQLVDSLTGLERILTSPIPFSYSAHLWTVTSVYCLALPPQIYNTLKWLTIPSTIIISFIFFGFLVAGEEIEDPFGYDKNDLNLDHFTRDIIRNELRAVTSAPPPDPQSWAFVPGNDMLFTRTLGAARRTPEEWLKAGSGAVQRSLSTF